MKKALFAIIILELIAALNASDLCAQVEINYVDPLIKVFKADVTAANITPTLDAALSDFVSLQYAVRSNYPVKGLSATVISLTNGANKLTNCKIKFVGYVKINNLAKDPSPDVLKPTDKLYPDPLLEAASIDIAPNSTQPIWVTIAIPNNTAPGLYKGQIKFNASINGKVISSVKDFNIKVYPVSVINSTLMISLNPSVDNSRISSMDKYRQMSRKEVTEYSPEFWSLTEKMARMMKEYRQNMVLFYVIHLIDYGYSNGKYTFDFTKMDKLIGVYEKAGVLTRIEGGYLGGRNNGWWDGFDLFYYKSQGDKIVLSSGNIKNPEVIAFYQQLMPALVQHLKAKNWINKYYQRLVDEPVDANANSYIEIAKFIKKIAPELKTIEAVQTTKVTDYINISIPVLDFLKDNYNYYKNQINQGKEIWYYTCWLPQGNYANWFIEIPLLKTRYLHWINFKYNLKGYIHWAYNNWNNNSLSEGAETKSGGSILPAGDSWIVYPKTDGYLSSIRLEAVRDGIIDYELLNLLKKKNAKLAYQLSDLLIKNFDSYNMDVKQFRNTRRLILEALTK
ncbi:DUF4091 domain-containing protein [Chitinophaga sp. sic0106]|uniref:DUF4091 domain-containing protein n=1 Tax=Chitinophaga sp. sic0106 TaxID=2854785 RepID=UPI001C459553|nr:DUF4091 domain-containing protein [Chitinophaga sp. sic0106]MBV7529012.1 DUF4091 domain-containing protein [Chitinophaga sp. sic0106]